ncbi:MAG: hypothetical protein JXN65_10235 [Clostridia bacterium]|nr:hypothetical protein [Clostridia bacterium]
MKKIRNITVFMAVVSLLFFIAETWLKIDIPKNVMSIIELAAGILVALGILADTGEEPQPLTKASMIEKLKSPLAVGAVFALISYIIYRHLSQEQADYLLKILDTIIAAIFGFSVYNNPNNREAIR